MYIYLITNISNGKQYVGQTIQDPQKRWDQHKRDSKRYNYSIHMAIKKYGYDKFSFMILQECHSLEELNEAECFWIESLDTFKGDGYNMTSGGKSNNNVSEETRKKQSLAAKGRIPWNKGRTGIYSIETLEKMSNNKKGRVISEETRKKLSEINKGEGNGFYKKNHTSETKQKISKSKTGRKYSPEINIKKGRCGLNNASSRIVVQIDKNSNKEILCWFCAKYAYEYLNMKTNHILDVCKGRRKTSGGYKWKYLNHK